MSELNYKQHYKRYTECKGCRLPITFADIFYARICPHCGLQGLFERHISKKVGYRGFWHWLYCEFIGSHPIIEKSDGQKQNSGDVSE